MDQLKKLLEQQDKEAIEAMKAIEDPHLRSIAAAVLLRRTRATKNALEEQGVVSSTGKQQEVDVISSFPTRSTPTLAGCLAICACGYTMRREDRYDDGIRTFRCVKCHKRWSLSTNPETQEWMKG